MENGTQSNTRDHISVPIVDGGIGLEALENTMRAKLCPASPSWDAKCCIFRVPQVLKRHKREAYEPDFVSIGPFHHGGKQFQHMENVKQWYLNNLLSRRTNVTLKNLIDCVFQLEKSAREFYAEPLDHLSQNDLVEMMILDGCFVIELFRKYPSDAEHVDGNDPIFRMDCMFQYLCHDLLLLENQVPWFVLQHLYNLTLDPEPDKYSPSLTILMLTAFTSQKPLNHNCYSYLGNLIAFEQCYHHHSHEITSYAFLMNKLVASSKDMEILCEKRIIDNWLSAEDGANYFSKLCNDTVLNKFYYDELCAQVKMHYQIKWYR
ncbi:hypothetical protein Pyn_15456 [Prunus yedoensis var. nudiflora]|uniref:Uncharacterized protein n=1 Tax=Prunus yedoensis var. nudiflora TaxID=2094558 RepID=A0A314XJK4_PRUYE|nr:hypothetical protein Pyn_15456 [Prunus yedoensis var. nudiflora]